MLDLILRLLAPAPARLTAPDAKIALAALLVRVAKTDGLYSAEEMERIDKILGAQHGLDAFAATALRVEAEEVEAQAPDTVRFTRALKDAVALEDRESLLVALWQVALADGIRDADEDTMLRLLTNLLGLSDVESGLARQKAAQA